MWCLGPQPVTGAQLFAVLHAPAASAEPIVLLGDGRGLCWECRRKAWARLSPPTCVGPLGRCSSMMIAGLRRIYPWVLLALGALAFLSQAAVEDGRLKVCANIAALAALVVFMRTRGREQNPME